MHDAGDAVAAADGEQGVEIGDVRLLDRHLCRVEYGRERAGTAPDHDAALAPVEQCAHGVRPDEAEAAGDENHRVSLLG